MIDSEDAVVVLQGSPSELERWVERLAERGIRAAVVRPPAGSGSS